MSEFSTAHSETTSSNTVFPRCYRRRIVSKKSDKLQKPNFQCTETVQPYKCNLCTFETHLKLQLKEHKLLSCGNGSDKTLDITLNCDRCSFQTHSALVIFKHDLNCTNRYTCDKCNFKTLRPTCLRQHVRDKHSSEKGMQWFECAHCYYKMKRKGTLKKHIQKKHVNKMEKKLLKCKHCPFTSWWRKCLFIHVRKEHPRVMVPRWQQCEQCSFGTWRKEVLKRHVKALHRQISEKVGSKCKPNKSQIKPQDQSKQHIDGRNSKYTKQQERIYDKFIEPTYIVYMNDTHERAFKCKLCTVTAKRKSGFLYWHIQSKHSDVLEDGTAPKQLEQNQTKIGKLQCDQCLYKPDSEANLKLHKLFTHSNQKFSMTTKSLDGTLQIFQAAGLKVKKFQIFTPENGEDNFEVEIPDTETVRHSSGGEGSSKTDF